MNNYKHINEDIVPEKKVDILRWNRDRETIKIDENGNVYCKAWGNYLIQGKETIVETTELIDKYIEECKKPKKDRNFDFITILEKLPNFEEYEYSGPMINEDTLNYIMEE